MIIKDEYKNTPLQALTLIESSEFLKLMKILHQSGQNRSNSSNHETHRSLDSDRVIFINKFNSNQLITDLYKWGLSKSVKGKVVFVILSMELMDLIQKYLDQRQIIRKVLKIPAVTFHRLKKEIEIALREDSITKRESGALKQLTPHKKYSFRNW